MTEKAVETMLEKASELPEYSETTRPDTYFKSGFRLGYHQAEGELIDKAIGWIVEIYNCHEIMQYSDSCEPPLSELIEWFKNYMKEENINSK